MNILSVPDINRLSPVNLAFVGDAVFSLYVRQRLVLSCDSKSGRLTVLAAQKVSAAAQSKMYDAIFPLLTEEECATGRSARNAHTNNKAKNATLSDYKRATALEAVFGHLFLTGQTERLNEIMKKCFEVE